MRLEAWMIKAGKKLNRQQSKAQHAGGSRQKLQICPQSPGANGS